MNTVPEERRLGFSGENIFNNRVKEMNTFSLGWVLVFDLDDTISHFSRGEILINENIVDVLRLAIEARREGRVSAILLLTNNSDYNYIRHIASILNEILEEKVFDNGFYALTPGRIQNTQSGYSHPGYSVKSLTDVRRMLEDIHKPFEGLEYRTLFFDDQEHVLADELRKAGKEENYIKIDPPFTGSGEDFTNWEYVKGLLTKKGGSRRKRLTRKYKRKTKTRKS